MIEPLIERSIGLANRRTYARQGSPPIIIAVGNAHDAAIKGIERHCGISLQQRDSSLVSFSDPKEIDLVKAGFLKKKLALTNSDAELDAALAEVKETLKDDRTKNRVTVYYLLADKFGKLDLFR